MLNKPVASASAFSTDDSGRFVNGVLATVAAGSLLASRSRSPDAVGDDTVSSGV